MEMYQKAEDKLAAAKTLFDNGHYAEAAAMVYFALGLVRGVAEPPAELYAELEAGHLAYLRGENKADPEYARRVIQQAGRFLRSLRPRLDPWSWLGTGRTRLAVKLSAVILPAALMAFGLSHCEKSRSVIVEGESLRFAGGGAAEVVPQEGGWGLSRSLHLYVMAAEPSSFDFAFDLPESRQYTVYVYMTHSLNYGIIHFRLNGVSVGGDFDFFSTNVKRSDKVRLGRVALSKGTQTLTVEVRGKNPASSGFHFGIDQLVFEKE